MKVKILHNSRVSFFATTFHLWDFFVRVFCNDLLSIFGFSLHR